MSKINLPKNILEQEKYLALSSLEKGEYTNNLIEEILELNPNGATVSEIDREIYFGHSAIWHHLEILASRAVCLKVERGNTDVYHFNKVVASLKKLDIRGKYYYYSFELLLLF